MTAANTYNTIVISPNPKGRFVDGIISGTPKPGTVMQVKDATEKVGGNFTYEAYSRDADGNRPKGPIAVLCEDHLQGRTIDDAYETGQVGNLYFPLPGDELLMILQDVAGTGDDHTIGEILIVDSGTGKLIVTTGSPESEPFVCLETVTDPSADTLAHTMFAG